MGGWMQQLEGLLCGHV